MENHNLDFAEYGMSQSRYQLQRNQSFWSCNESVSSGSPTSKEDFQDLPYQEEFNKDNLRIPQYEYRHNLYPGSDMMNIPNYTSLPLSLSHVNISENPTGYFNNYDGEKSYYEMNISTNSFVRVVKRRNTANKKERRRTQSINNAFADLRDCIPNVPADTKLSKIKTLRLATSYIGYLMGVLASDDPNAIQTEFRADLVNQGRRSSKKDHDDTNSAVEEVHHKKSKGRTGWPQHVWALELKQEQGLQSNYE